VCLVCVCMCFECVVFGVILLLNALIYNSPAYSRKRIFASCRPWNFRFLYKQEYY
jgi:hypothetical protein